MKSVAKWLASLVGLCVAAVLGLILYVVVFFDPNDFKDDIESQVLEQTGVKLSIGKPIEWSFFPWFALDIGGVQVDLPEPSEKPFVELEQVRLGLKVMPLLRGQIEMSDVVLREPQIYLELDKQGVGNWEQLTGGADSGDAAASTENPEDVSSGEASGIEIDIAQVQIVDAQIIFNDLSVGERYELKDFNFSASNINFEEYFPVDMRFDLLASGITANSDISMKMNYALDQERLEINDLKYQVNANFSKENMAIQGDLATNVAIDLAKSYYNISSFEADLGVLSPAISSESVPLKLKFKGALDLLDSEIILSDLNANSLGMNINGDINVQNFSEKPLISGRLETNKFDLKKIMADLGLPAIETQDPSVLTQVQYKASISGPANHLGFKAIQAKLDDTSIDGNVQYHLETGAIKSVLNVDQINVDRYLAPEVAISESTAPEQAANREPVAEEPLVPTEVVRSLIIDSQINVSDLTAADGLKMQNIHLALKANKGVVNVSKLTANLYQGSLSASANLDARSDNPRYKLHSELIQVQLAPLLKHFAETDLVSGQINFLADLSGSGNYLSDVKTSLQGAANYAIANGEIKQNLLKPVCEGFALINKDQLSAESWPNTTPFEAFEGRFDINNGVVNNKNMQIKLAGFNITGKGLVDLPKESYDYTASLIVTGDTRDQACEVNKRYRDIAWPINCSGSFGNEFNNSCRPDLDAMRSSFGQLAKTELKREAEKKLQEKLQKELGQGEEQSLDEMKEVAKDKVDDKLKEEGKKLFDKLSDKLKF